MSDEITIEAGEQIECSGCKEKDEHIARLKDICDARREREKGLRDELTRRQAEVDAGAQETIEYWKKAAVELEAESDALRHRLTGAENCASKFEEWWRRERKTVEILRRQYDPELQRAVDAERGPSGVSRLPDHKHGVQVHIRGDYLEEWE